MITVSDKFKEAFLNGNQKQILLEFSDGTTLDNEGIVSETFSLEQALCDEEQIVFGLVSSACFRIQLYNTGKRYSGLSVTPSIGVIDDEGNYHIMRFGTYKIVEDRRTDDRMYREITAYDSLHDVLGTDYADFYNAFFIENPIGATLKDFRQAFFAHVGIRLKNAILEFDNLQIHGKEDVKNLSGSEIIRNICEIETVFGFIDNDGAFKFTIPFKEIGLYPADDLYPEDDLYPQEGATESIYTDVPDQAPILGGIVYSDYYVQPITQVCIPESETTAMALVGVDGNCYRTQKNVLLYGQSDEKVMQIAQRMLTSLRKFTYIPSRVTMRARPWLELGDTIAVLTRKEGTKFPILHRTTTGVTALYDTFEAKGREYFEYSANLTQNTVADFNNFKEQTKVRLQKTDSSIEAEVTRREAGDVELSNRITVNAEGLSAEITRATGAESGLSTRINATNDSITTEVANRENADIEIRSSITETAESIRFDVSKAVTDEKKRAEKAEEDLDASITMTAKSIVTEVSKEETRAKGVENSLSSRITTNAGNIELKVSKNAIISTINQSAESVSINASKINLNGAVTANNNVKIGTDGKITINGGSISIQNSTGTQTFSVNSSGKLSATGAAISGTITASSISGSSLTTKGIKISNGVMSIQYAASDDEEFWSGTPVKLVGRNTDDYEINNNTYGINTKTGVHFLSNVIGFSSRISVSTGYVNGVSESHRPNFESCSFVASLDHGAVLMDVRLTKDSSGNYSLVKTRKIVGNGIITAANYIE